MARLQDLLEEGVASGAFPSAQAVVFAQGKVAFEGAAGDATLSTVYDLSSLTKILCTTALFMDAWTEGLLTPETRVAEFLPDSPAGTARVTLEDLLFHRAGYPASVPLWADVLRKTRSLLDTDCPRVVRQSVREAAIEAALRVPLERAPREEAVYCDVGFILLGELLERKAETSLDLLFDERIARRLELPLHFRRLSARHPIPETVASTGKTRPRELAPGQKPPPGSPIPSVSSRAGEVDDDNAWVMDGVAGHAGLFGTAHAVARFGQVMLEDLEGGGRIASRELWERAFRRDPVTPGSTRALGFDTPSTEGSSVGAAFGRGPKGAVGHLGFTGVSLWVDLEKQWVVALNTNRTLHGRANIQIRDFRPRFHDAVVEVLSGAKHG